MTPVRRSRVAMDPRASSAYIYLVVNVRIHPINQPPMSSSPTVFFPSPIGGVPFTIDLAPSVLFALLYAALAPLVIYRVASAKSRTIILAGTFIFSLQRIADMALRAQEAHVPSDRTSNSNIKYLQTTYATGFIGMGHGLLEMLRCLLMSATKGTPPSETSATCPNDIELQRPPIGESTNTSPSKMGSKDNVGVVYTPVDSMRSRSFSFTPIPATTVLFPPTREDQPGRRKRIQTIASLTLIPFGISILMAIIAGNNYYKSFTSASEGHTVGLVRAASTSLALILFQATNITAFTCMVTDRRVSRGRALYICALTCLLSVVGVYRLVVMRCTTDALESAAPCSLNSTAAKAAFYVFHMAPEYLTAVAIWGVNIRATFQTGTWGKV